MDGAAAPAATAANNSSAAPRASGSNWLIPEELARQHRADERGERAAGADAGQQRQPVLAHDRRYDVPQRDSHRVEICLPDLSTVKQKGSWSCNHEPFLYEHRHLGTGSRKPEAGRLPLVRAQRHEQRPSVPLDHEERWLAVLAIQGRLHVGRGFHDPAVDLLNDFRRRRRSDRAARPRRRRRRTAASCRTALHRCARRTCCGRRGSSPLPARRPSRSASRYGRCAGP